MSGPESPALAAFGRRETFSELFEGALTIAGDAYPGLERERQRRLLAELAAPLLPFELATRDAPTQAALLAGHLHETCGFLGNASNYFEPDNSFINRVLERRLGIPISLAVVYIEVANWVGVEAHGVGFPGHFLVRIERSGTSVIVDPFSGCSLERADLEGLLARATHGKLALSEDMLSATPTPHILARMLFNLRGIYRQRGDQRNLLVTLDRLVELLPDAVELRRDRGLAFAQLGAQAAAIEDLDVYLRTLPHAPDADSIRGLLGKLRQRGPGLLV